MSRGSKETKGEENDFIKARCIIKLSKFAILRNQADLDVVYKPDGTPESSAFEMIPLSSRLMDAESLPDLAALVLSHPGLPAKEKRCLARMLLACEPITAELAGQVTT